MSVTPCRECSGKFGAGPLCEVCGALQRIRSYLLSPRCPSALWESVSERLTDLHRRVLEEAEAFWAKDHNTSPPSGATPPASGVAPTGERKEGVPEPVPPVASGGGTKSASEAGEESESSEEPSAPEADEVDYGRPPSRSPTPPRETRRGRSRSKHHRRKRSKRTPSPPPEPPREWVDNLRIRKRRREDSPHRGDTEGPRREPPREGRERSTRERPRSPSRSPAHRSSGWRGSGRDREAEDSDRPRGKHEKQKKNKGKAKRDRNRQYWKGKGKGKHKGQK